MKKNATATLLIAMLMSIGCQVKAQDPPVFSQFFANPYQFNPSYAAHNGYAEANVFYRKQWVGFDNAPEALSVNAHAPVGRNTALGFTAYSNKTVLLNTSAILATFGYKVRFGNSSHLNFGLSGGMGFNSFKLEALENSNDPALLNVIPKSNSLNGQFGLNLTLKNFNFGFALPTLFESRITTRTENNRAEEKFSPFDDKFGSISYTAKLGDLTLVPAVLYRSLDNVQFQWEGMIVAHYKNILWVGTSYREGYGITGLIGFNIKGLLKIGYNYEKPTGPISRAPNGGTHEIYLGAKLGKYNRDEAVLAQRLKKDSVNSVNDEMSTDQYADNSSESDVRLADGSVQQDNDDEIARDGFNINDGGELLPHDSSVEPETAVNEPVSKKHYVVLGVYKHYTNASRQIANLKAKGLEPSVLFVPQKEYYYVYVFQSSERDEAVKERKRARQSNQFFGAWIFSVE
jgi:type IX secretion system PorP/SprF family membrane protein